MRSNNYNYRDNDDTDEDVKTKIMHSQVKVL